MSQKCDEAVLSCFVKNTADYRVKPLGAGLINQTLLIEGDNDCFVLQCINQQVFPQPQNVVDNSLLISRHLDSLGANYTLKVMKPRASLNGDYLVCVSGQYWRALTFIKECISPQTIDDGKQAKQAARTFAQFSMALRDISPLDMKPIIVDFHDLVARLSQLCDAAQSANKQRLMAAQTTIKQYFSQTEFIQLVNKLIEQLPQRITHNDTKINNLLFDESTLEPLAVIDLDTCMPGYLMHDFGDMVRTCCSTLAEDACNIDEMAIKSDIFNHLLSGYLSGLDEDVSDLEKDSLLVGARLMPFIIGCRFLTDYLNDDVYFNTSHESHNLDRAVNQFKLYQLLSEHLSCLENKHIKVEF